MTLKDSLLNPYIINNTYDTCIKPITTMGKYFIDNPDNYEFLLYKSAFEMILLFIIIRYVAYNIHFFYKKIKGKELIIKFIDILTIQLFFLKIRKRYFKDMKKLFTGKIPIEKLFPIIDENPFIRIHDFMLILIEIRILILIQFMYF